MILEYLILLGDTIMSLEDMFDETESSFFPLTVVRVYSAYIHKRRTMGPVGVGWHLSLWYVKLKGIYRYTL